MTNVTMKELEARDMRAIALDRLNRQQLALDAVIRKSLLPSEMRKCAKNNYIDEIDMETIRIVWNQRMEGESLTTTKE